MEWLVAPVLGQYIKIECGRELACVQGVFNANFSIIKAGNWCLGDKADGGRGRGRRC